MAVVSYIGFFGCSNKLMRVEWTGRPAKRRQSTGAFSAHKGARVSTTTRPDTTWCVKCPACHHKHMINVTWRDRGSYRTDKQFKADIVLPKAEVKK